MTKEPIASPILSPIRLATTTRHFTRIPSLPMSDPGITVVLIEDEKQIRRFVRSALEGEGIVVHDAETGKQGLVEAATRKPDLVIVDLGLPDTDGLDVIRELRGWSELPVIVLSARTRRAKKSPRSTPARTTTSPSRSACPNCWRGFGRRCGGAITAARTSRRWCASARSPSIWPCGK